MYVNLSPWILRHGSASSSVAVSTASFSIRFSYGLLMPGGGMASGGTAATPVPTPGGAPAPVLPLVAAGVLLVAPNALRCCCAAPFQISGVSSAACFASSGTLSTPPFAASSSLRIANKSLRV
jgi:hypothetical protein